MSPSISIKRGAAVAVLSLVTLAAVHDVAHAQSGALPPAPGADKANQGAPTQAKASLPNGESSSALEPYLVTWILPVGGVISVLLAGVLDKREQARGAGAGRRIVRPAAR